MSLKTTKIVRAKLKSPSVKTYMKSMRRTECAVARLLINLKEKVFLQLESSYSIPVQIWTEFLDCLAIRSLAYRLVYGISDVLIW